MYRALGAPRSGFCLKKNSKFPSLHNFYVVFQLFRCSRHAIASNIILNFNFLEKKKVEGDEEGDAKACVSCLSRAEPIIVEEAGGQPAGSRRIEIREN